MRRILLAFLVAASFVPFLSPSSAQAADGSSFAGTDGSLYLHITRGSAVTFYSNTLLNDPANTGTDDGLNALGFGLGNAPGEADFDFPMAPTLASSLTLTKGADVLFDIWVGGSSASQNGQVTVTATLLTGSTTIATATSATVTYQGDMHEVTMKAPAQVAAVAAADNLQVSLAMKGIGSFIHVGNGGKTQSKVQLPMIPIAVPSSRIVTYENLTGPTVTLSRTLANATSRLDHYNWTSAGPALDVTFNGTVLNGTVSATVQDATGKVLFTKALSASASGKQSLTGLSAGRWKIAVNYTAFKGTFRLGIAPPPATTTGTGTTAAGSTASGTSTVTGAGAASGTSGGAGTSTGAAATSGSGTSKGAPALGAAATLALLGLALLRRRLA